MTGKLLAYHLKCPRVPLVVRVPLFANHCVSGSGCTKSEYSKLKLFCD